MQFAKLSAADAKILNQVFDPESGPTRVEIIVDPSLPADRNIVDPKLLKALKEREKSAIKLVEDFERSKSQDTKAKATVYLNATHILDAMIQDYPKYASARNNRAQLRRWQFGDRNMICQRRSSRDQERTDAAQSAVADLKQAIHLTAPLRPQDAVSPAQGKLLAQTYTQLGALLFAASKDSAEQDSNDSSRTPLDILDEHFANWTTNSFEEEASRCFYLGGLYGNEVAKALAVHTNPHAKLCGNIVKEAMRKELAGVEV